MSHAWRLGQEYPPEGEELVSRQIVATMRRAYEQRRPVTRRALRDQHAKAHGCLEAEFVVRDDVPGHLRHGVFRTPRTYGAWVRFSPSWPRPRPDQVRDVQGMAVKLVGVAGDKILDAEKHAVTQDFVLANSRVFFCRNVDDYADLTARALDGKLWRFFVVGWDPRKWRVREFVNLIAGSQRRVYNPLHIRYWSQTAYRLGPHAVKYSARPSKPPLKWKSDTSEPNFIRQAMASELRHREARFDFMLQLQTDPVRMPIEDPTVVWKETASPFVPVATLRIPAQSLAAEGREEFGEHLSFSPWHSLPEHRPLGGINRVRRAAYDALSELRHRKNGVPRREPDGQSR